MRSKFIAALVLCLSFGSPAYAVTAGNAVCFNDTLGGATKDCGNNGTSTAAIVADGAGFNTKPNGTTTANQVYQMIFPGATSYDAVRGMATATLGSTTTGVTGIAGYVLDLNPVSGVSQSAEAIFGVGTTGVNGAALWGINTLIMDNTSYAVSTWTGVVLKNEFDFNVTSTSTVVQGLVLTGASLSTPASSIGIQLGPLAITPSVIAWGTGVNSVDGSVVTFASVGMTAVTGTPSGSQPIKFHSRTSGGVNQTAFVQMTQPGDMVVALGSISNSLFVTSSNGTTDLAQFQGVTAAVNYPTLQAAATNNGVSLIASGTDSNININLTPKGTGTVVLSSVPASAGGGGVYLCVDTSGLIYKKSSCP